MFERRRVDRESTRRFVVLAAGMGSFRGQLAEVVSGPQRVPASDAPGPASTSTIPERPGFAAGMPLGFRLLQPVDLQLR